MYLNILKEIVASHLTPNDLAKSMKIPPRVLYSKLRKEMELTIKDIFIMQKIFNRKYCTFDYLLNEQ